MNVIAIVAHGINCHWLAPYGNEWMSTPAFDALACESIVFDRHFANQPSSEGFQNSCRDNALRSTDIFKIFIDDRKGAHDAPPCDHIIRTDPAAHPTPGDALLAAIESALTMLPADRRWLLWIETDRLIPPWDFEFETYQQYAEESGGFIENREIESEEPIDEPALGPIGPNDESLWHRLRNSYAAAITSFDAEMAAMLTSFRKRGLDRSAAWIVTSGYGLPLGEHGIVGTAGSRLHEELVHLPLIVRLPDGREAMRRVAAITQPSNLPATILELLEVESNSPSLVGHLSGSATELRKFCRVALDGERALRTDDWAFLPTTESQPVRLYFKPDDIWEVNDLAPRHADECDRLLALLNSENPT